MIASSASFESSPELEYITHSPFSSGFAAECMLAADVLRYDIIYGDLPDKYISDERKHLLKTHLMSD